MSRRWDLIPSCSDAPFHCPPDENRSERFLRELRRSPPAPAESFYESKAWLELRYFMLSQYGKICMLCGAGGTPRNPIQVDHIKPRSKYPELELVRSNLQVLCKACNHGKSNTDQTDFRFRPSAELVANIKKKIAG
jgi:5-methylcytosine-specific restriction endonuclease McrA